MKPNKIGQIAKFHTPLEDEDPGQLYVIIEIIEDDKNSRVHIQALNTGLTFPPINTVCLDDLEIVEVSTLDLIGYRVTITKSDNSHVDGIVVEVSEPSIMLDLSKKSNGVETNVFVTIKDNKGKEHRGKLYVN